VLAPPRGNGENATNPKLSPFTAGVCQELALSLVKEGKLQIRNCEGYAFELPKEKRRELITKFNLRERWSEFYYCHPEWEIQDVMDNRE